MLFLQYPKCSTCQKAKKWLDGHRIEYTDRHIVEDNPTYGELKERSTERRFRKVDKAHKECYNKYNNRERRKDLC